MKNITQVVFVLALGFLVGVVTLATPIYAKAASAAKGKHGGLRVLDDVPCPPPSPSPSPGG